MLTEHEAEKIVRRSLARQNVPFAGLASDEVISCLKLAGAFRPDKSNLCTDCKGYGLVPGTYSQITCATCHGSGIAPTFNAPVQGANADIHREVANAAAKFAPTVLTSEEVEFIRGLKRAYEGNNVEPVYEKYATNKLPRPGDTIYMRTGNRKTYKEKVLKSITRATGWAGGYRITVEGSKTQYGANHIKGWKQL